MGKANFPLIVLLVCLIIIATFAFSFFNKAQELSNKNNQLNAEKIKLSEENSYIAKEKDRLASETEEFKEELERVKEELSLLDKNKRDIQTENSFLKREKRELLLKLKKAQTAPRAPATYVEEKRYSSSGAVPAHWEGVVKEKAQLEAGIEKLEKKLTEAKGKIFSLDKVNKELSIKIDELTKVRERLENDIAFKDRTVQLLSRDLVNQKETCRELSLEVNNLRDQNISLKRELIASNEQQLQMETMLKQTDDKRSVLDEKVETIERVLKEKALLFQQLKGELAQALQKSDEEKIQSTIDLPPITVSQEEKEFPVEVPVRPANVLQGEIIAVNQNENFVIIDLGKDSGLLPGVTMDVVRGSQTVGTIEVIEVRKEIAAADIKSVTSGASIQEADSVISK